MLALILTRKLRPMMTGSSSGWLMLAGMMARPRAISERTNSGVMKAGISAPKSSPSARRSLGAVQHGGFAADVLAVGDVDHLLGDDAGAGELVLRDHLARAGGEHGLVRGTGRDKLVVPDMAVVLGLDLARGDHVEVAPGEPRGADRVQAGFELDGGAGVGVGAGRVVDPESVLAGGRLQRDLAERHADVRPALGAGVDLVAADDRPGGDGGWLGLHGHRCVLLRRSAAGREEWDGGHRPLSRPSAGINRIRFAGSPRCRNGQRYLSPMAGHPSEGGRMWPGSGACQMPATASRSRRPGAPPPRRPAGSAPGGGTRCR